MKTANPKRNAKTFFAALATPTGMTKDVGRSAPEWGEKKGHPQVTFTGDGIEIKVGGLAITDDGWADGHTSFTTSKGQRTFDRTGVEDSFYVDAKDTVKSVNAKIAEQITRVAESRARLARSETVPGLPGDWSVTPERRAEVGSALRTGGYHNFTPSGFGIGYCVTTRRPRDMRYGGGGMLPLVTSKFFGLTKPLYYTTLDCD